MIYELKYLVERAAYVDVPDRAVAEGLLSQIIARERSVPGTPSVIPLSIIPFTPPAQPVHGQTVVKVKRKTA